LLDAAEGPCEGKGSDEQTLFRGLLGNLDAGDVLLGDDMGRSDVVAEVVLAGIPLEEAVQLDVAAGEAGSIIGACQRPHDDLSH
jgi:hypothetical protein